MVSLERAKARMMGKQQSTKEGMKWPMSASCLGMICVWKSDLSLARGPVDHNEPKVIPNIVDDATTVTTSDTITPDCTNKPSSFQENLKQQATCTQCAKFEIVRNNTQASWFIFLIV